MTDSPLWLIWLDSLAWLNRNSSAVTALATLAGVVIAATYSVFAALQWRATNAQADITRRIFEASHRPYVTTEVREPTDTGTHGRLSFAIAFENSGTVPADITAWEVHGTLVDLEGHEQPVDRMDPIENPVGRSLGPRERAMLELHFVGAPCRTRRCRSDCTGRLSTVASRRGPTAPSSTPSV